MAKYNMKDRKDMSMGTSDYDKGYNKGMNERYMSNIKGMDQKVMKNHGNTMPIGTCENEKYDLNRMDWKPYNRQGYSEKAFDYKF